MLGFYNSIGYAWRAALGAEREFFLLLLFVLLMSILLESHQRSQKLIAILAEKWFDTTHTLHWSWEEMTLTPLDLFALTEISTGGLSRFFRVSRRVSRLPWNDVLRVPVFLI